MINNENTMYMYCNVLGQTEPEKILDIGLFYRQIGGVSRTILNSDVPKKCFITGIDLENSKNYGVYNTIYDAIRISRAKSINQLNSNLPNLIRNAFFATL